MFCDCSLGDVTMEFSDGFDAKKVVWEDGAVVDTVTAAMFDCVVVTLPPPLLCDAGCTEVDAGLFDVAVVTALLSFIEDTGVTELVSPLELAKFPVTEVLPGFCDDVIAVLLVSCDDCPTVVADVTLLEPLVARLFTVPCEESAVKTVGTRLLDSCTVVLVVLGVVIIIEVVGGNRVLSAITPCSSKKINVADRSPCEIDILCIFIAFQSQLPL